MKPAFTLLAGLAFAGCTIYEDGDPVNRRPVPPLVFGPDTLVRGVIGRFEVTVGDPDGDRLRLYVAWGDGDTVDYGEFIPSGATVPLEHRYPAAGAYEVRARCHDPEPLFSGWSAPRAVLVLEP